MGDMRQVYCRFCGQTFFTDDLDQCSACLARGGLIDPAAPSAIKDVVARKQEETHSVSAPDFPSVPFAKAFNIYRWLKLILAGVVVILIGVFLLLDPRLRTDPRVLTLNDLMAGLCAIFVGVVLLTLPVLAFLAGRKRPRD
jgi:hypothetical protein